MIDTSKFAIQQIFTVDAFNLDDGSLNTRLEDLKSSTLSNNGTIVYSQGGIGNPKIVGFSHSKEASLTIENALITEGGLDIQIGGTSVLTNSNEVPFDEVITVATADTAITSYAATGTAGSELGYVYILNSDGTIKQKLAQAAAVAADKFTYATATKTITFNTGAVAVGTKVLAIYYPTISSVIKASNKTDVFAKSMRLHCKTLFRDTCTNEDYVGVLVIYKAKCGEEWSLELSADGDPAVHNMVFEALKSCESNTLWDIFIYDKDDIA